MAKFIVTIKQSGFKHGVAFEKGMSVDVITQFPTNPVIHNQGKAVNDAFLRIYGIDLKKVGLLSLSYLDVKQV